MKSQRQKPFRLVTDKLGSYCAAHRSVMPLVTHDTRQYANNRAEVSHQAARQRGSAKCDGSNRRIRPNDSCMSTAWFRISFGWADTDSDPFITACFERVRSPCGPR